MKRFRGVFSQNRNWFTDLIYILFNRIIAWLFFRLPFSENRLKIMTWFVQHDPEEYSGS
jgi:hypothetical protein